MCLYTKAVSHHPIFASLLRDYVVNVFTNRTIRLSLSLMYAE
jgi:hypothetical protein